MENCRDEMYWTIGDLKSGESSKKRAGSFRPAKWSRSSRPAVMKQVLMSQFSKITLLLGLRLLEPVVFVRTGLIGKHKVPSYLSVGAPANGPSHGSKRLSGREPLPNSKSSLTISDSLTLDEKVNLRRQKLVYPSRKSTRDCMGYSVLLAGGILRRADLEDIAFA